MSPYDVVDFTSIQTCASNSPLKLPEHHFAASVSTATPREMEITPGQKFIARYRLVIADGEPATKAAAAWWDDYAQAR